MSCRFHFDFTGSGDALVSKIRGKIFAAGGQFEGSGEFGNFSVPTPIGEFRGTYSVQSTTIWVDVDDKPAFVPCSAIESKLREMVKSQR